METRLRELKKKLRFPRSFMTVIHNRDEREKGRDWRGKKRNERAGVPGEC